MYQMDHILVSGQPIGGLSEQLHWVSATLQYFLDENRVEGLLVFGGGFSLPIVQVCTVALSFGCRTAEKAHVQLFLQSISLKSFTVGARIFLDEMLCSYVRVTHVALEKKTNSTIPLPGVLKSKLSLLEECGQDSFI